MAEPVKVAGVQMDVTLGEPERNLARMLAYLEETHTQGALLTVFPELAPIAELGVPGYQATNWHMVIAPAKTPPAVVDKLSAEIRAVSALPEIKERIAKIGLIPLQSPPPAELKTFLDGEITTWGKFVQQIGLAGSM